MKRKLSHLDAKGRARMVDVGRKPPMQREAWAKGSVLMSPATVGLIRNGNLPKGDVLSTARIAGIMAAKRTPELIPLCHPLTLSAIDVDMELCPDRVNIASRVSCVGQTGVEMEALTAVSAAALAVYDMCKAVDKGMIISEIALVEKKKKKLPKRAI